MFGKSRYKICLRVISLFLIQAFVLSNAQVSFAAFDKYEKSQLDISTLAPKLSLPSLPVALFGRIIKRGAFLDVLRLPFLRNIFNHIKKTGKLCTVGEISYGADVSFYEARGLLEWLASPDRQADPKAEFRGIKKIVSENGETFYQYVNPDAEAKNTKSADLVEVNENFRSLRNLPKLLEDFDAENLEQAEAVLCRVNVNVPAEADGSIKDATRLDNTKKLIEFLLSLGLTPVLYGHNGSLKFKKDGEPIDKRQSLERVADYIQKLFPDTRVVFHKGQYQKDTVLLHQGWTDITKDEDGNDIKIIPNAINIINNVRLDGREEGTALEQKELGYKLMNFAGPNKVLISDAFGDMGSIGSSIQYVPYFANKLYLGPEMLKEFEEIKQILEGIDGLVFGGEKLDKLALLKGLLKVIREGGFALVASGPSNELDKNPALIKELKDINADAFIKTDDYSDNTHYDIGPKTLANFLSKLDSMKEGQTLLVNGTMGFMEEKSGKYQQGTKQTWNKLQELAQRGVKVVVVGGDAGKTSKKYGLDKQPNVVTFTGGGVVLKILAGTFLSGIKTLAARQVAIEIIFNDAIPVNSLRSKTGTSLSEEDVKKELISLAIEGKIDMLTNSEIANVKIAAEAIEQFLRDTNRFSWISTLNKLLVDKNNLKAAREASLTLTFGAMHGEKVILDEEILSEPLHLELTLLQLISMLENTGQAEDEALELEEEYVLSTIKSEGVYDFNNLGATLKELISDKGIEQNVDLIAPLKILFNTPPASKNHVEQFIRDYIKDTPIAKRLSYLLSLELAKKQYVKKDYLRQIRIIIEENIDNMTKMASELQEIPEAAIEVVNLVDEMNKTLLISSIIAQFNLFDKIAFEDLKAAKTAVLEDKQFAQKLEGYKVAMDLAILDGKHTPVGVFAGAGTRMKKGSFNFLDPWSVFDDQIEEGKDFLIPKHALRNIGLGQRQLIQLRIAIEELAAKYDMEANEALSKQTVVLFVNSQIERDVRKDLIVRDFYGFRPENIIIINQPRLPGWYFDRDGDIKLDTRSKLFPYNHGWVRMQLNWKNQGYTLDKEGNILSIQESVREYLGTKGVEIVSINRVNDLTRITASESVIEKEFLALSKLLKDEYGFNLFCPLVGNPGGQKGGLGFAGADAEGMILLEGLNAVSSTFDDILEEITAQAEAEGRGGMPYNKMAQVDYIHETADAIEQGLPLTLRYREERIYLEVPTGDQTQVDGIKAKAIMRMTDRFDPTQTQGELIYDFKTPADTVHAFSFFNNQDKQPRFRELAEELGFINNPNPNTQATLFSIDEIKKRIGQPQDALELQLKSTALILQAI